MSFLSPLSFLLLIPLGAAIVILYLLKLRRRERTISSVLLWRDAVADIQANAPFQKLKKSLLLLLQLAVLLFLVVTVAGPYMKVKGISENKIVVILDSSASMQSMDVSPSRFEVAKSQAIGIVNKMGPGDTMLVMTVGAKSRVIIPFTSDKRALNGAISKLKPVDTPCNMRQGIAMALSLAAGKSTTPARVVVLSDGQFGSLSDLPTSRAKLDFLKIGKQCGNVAITGLSTRKPLSGKQQVFIGLQNFSGDARKFNLEIYLNGQLVDIREESISAGGRKQEILQNVDNWDGAITAKLDLKDDLAADNRSTVYLSGPKKVSVLLVSAGNIFLQNAFNIDPSTQVARVDSYPSDMKGRKYDLVVFDGVKPPSALPPGGYLLINTSSAQGPASEGDAVENPTITDFARNHPAGAYVDFENVHILKARYLHLKPWATPLIEGPEGALGAAGSVDGRSFIQLPWSLLDSDFPLRVGFPIFVTNCLDWLATPENTSAGESIRAGQPMYIGVPPDTRAITVINPDGSKQDIEVTQTPVAYDNTEQVGIYKISAKGIKKEFACNLLSSQESNTKPADVSIMGKKSLPSNGNSVRTNRELYGPLILIALAILAFEWYAYHRRL